jgi:DNA topoisomerase-1
MAKNLVIVESPAKAKTIEGFLGKDYVVKSSFGHVRDLVKKGMGVDVENDFAPNYEVQDDKKNVISELKKLSKSAEKVWLASDEDREGEAISWHLSEVLDLDKKKTCRIVFHEITKNAILDAIAHPRDIDQHLVNAQQARRVLDRLVGFELSPVLWKKIKPSLSAGRVQSVAVRLIVEREREYNDFRAVSAFRVLAEFITPRNQALHAELQNRFPEFGDAEKFLRACDQATFHVENLDVKPGKKSPSAPFTTSTLQQEASRKLGFSVAQTMSVAQRLYESGKITYMRTDSTNLSDLALNTAADTILKMYGKAYHQRRQFRTKSKGAQEAHEAIRPTYLSNPTVEGDAQEKKLYDLIWKRTMASQMSEAQLEKTTVTIGISNSPEKFIAKGEVIKFDGFLKLYIESVDEEEQEGGEGILPMTIPGELLNMDHMDAIEKFSLPPARYTEASLVKKLEELGIGRPSTYAPTISTIQNRGYVEKGERDGAKRTLRLIGLKNHTVKISEKHENTGSDKGKLLPTDIGMVVNDFLIAHFPGIVDYHFTATVEKEFDDIAEGNLSWQNMLKKFYGQFHEQVSQTIENSDRAKTDRLLGTDPNSGKNVYAKIGRFGPMVQIGENTDEEKPKFSSLQAHQRIETITLGEAMELFKLPRILGSYQGKEVTVSAGRFGPYVKWGDLFASLTKEDNPLSIGIDRAIELIEIKKQKDQDKLIRVFDGNPDVKILKGRWGPYLAYKKENFRLPKDAVAESMSLEDCMKIIGSNSSAKSKAASSKPVAKASAPKKKSTTSKASSKSVKKKK